MPQIEATWNFTVWSLMLRGDIVVAFGQVAITRVDDRHWVLGEEQINKVVDVSVIRRGERRTIPVTPVESARD